MTTQNRTSRELGLSIVIPVYNERENLRPLYKGLCSVLEVIDREAEILFVDDGSKDGSSEILDELAAQDPLVKVIHFRRNFGQTAAMMAGFRNSQGAVIIPLDGDMQNDPADIPRLLEKLDEGFDVVSGWREQRKDAAVKRNLPSRIANWMISGVSGVVLHDYGCTLKAYRREILEHVRLYGEMHRFIPIYAAWEGAKVAELPVVHHPRSFGKSKYGLSRIPRVILDLIVIRFLDKALDRPMQFFGQAGLNCFGLAFLIGLWTLWLKLADGVSFILTPLPLLIVLLVITGVLCVLMGLLAEVQSRVYFATSGRASYVVRSTCNMLEKVK